MRGRGLSWRTQVNLSKIRSNREPCIRIPPKAAINFLGSLSGRAFGPESPRPLWKCFATSPAKNVRIAICRILILQSRGTVATIFSTTLGRQGGVATTQ